MQILLGESAGALKISGDAEIGDAEELRRALADWSAQASELKLDLSELDACDASTVQLLVSLCKTAAAAGKAIAFQAGSERLTRVCCELGVPLEFSMNPVGSDRGAPAKKSKKRNVRAQ